MQRLEKWRLLLGKNAQDTIGYSLESSTQKMDLVLDELYDSNESQRSGGLGSSSPKVSRWLGDIRKYFPKSVVQVMQKDAFDRLGIEQMLLEPEFLESVEADVHLVANLLNLNKVIPSKTKDSARKVVKKVVDELMKKLENPMQQAIKGAINKAIRNYRPSYKEIDWNKTIQANLKNYLPEYQTVIPERLIGYGRKSKGSLKDVILCVDQSGSMAPSVVYSSIFGAVMASIRAIKTQMVLFDTSVIDLTQDLEDPVDLLFGSQLGGGTDINKALKYCQGLVSKPQDTILVLITDLYEGGNEKEMIKRAASLKASGVQIITLLALSDEGAPFYSKSTAQKMSNLGIPCFACTPDQFPDLMATAIQKGDFNPILEKNLVN